MKITLEESDFEIINLNDWENNPFGASPKKPNVLIIWPDMTQEELINLKEKLKRVNIK